MSNTKATKSAIKTAALRTDILRNELCEVECSDRSAAVKSAMRKSINASLKAATAELERLQAAR